MNREILERLYDVEAEGVYRYALALAGREALLVYVLHLVLIHAFPFRDATLEQKYGGTQSIGKVVAWFILLSVICVAVARGNEWRKARNRRKLAARRGAQDPAASR